MTAAVTHSHITSFWMNHAALAISGPAMLFNRFDYFVFLAVGVVAYWLLVYRPEARKVLGVAILGGAIANAATIGPGDASFNTTLLASLWFVVAGCTFWFGRFGFLFTISVAFYMSWNAWYIWLLAASTLIDFVASHRIHEASTQRRKKAWLALSLVSNLGLLFAFKYYNFFAPQVAAALKGLGFGVEDAVLELALPVGISFYTFQTLSYTIDVYRGELKPARFLPFATFVTYFPQLVAGPIVRASELLPQFESKPSVTQRQVSQGLFLIGVGLFKKVVIADYLAANLVDRVFDQPDMFSSVEVLLALYGFTMQIYCDFSGYTDVARGSSKLMGFELAENFDRPYQATNPAEFWRRWHMTLSRWLRDYLYFPLGGSKVGHVRAYFNLALTMFLVGMWHAWWATVEVFFWYALLQAVAMVAHRFFVRRRRNKQPAPDRLWVHGLKIALALHFVVFTRILFRAKDMDTAGRVADRLWSGVETVSLALSEGLSGSALADATSTAQVTGALWLLLVLSYAAHFTPKRWFEQLAERFVAAPAPVQAIALAATAHVLALTAASEAAPFIYLQF